MSRLHDMVLNASAADLESAAQRGDIPADELWDEVLASMDCSVMALRGMSDTNRDALASLDATLNRVAARQKEVDTLIDEWRRMAGRQHLQKASHGS